MNNPKTEEVVETLRGLALGAHPLTDKVMLIAANRLEQLQQELIDERYRHDRYADFCVAQGEELSRLKAQHRWIPVTERLPEVSTRTLVSIDDCVGVAYFVHGNSGMCFFSDYTGKPLTFVTHWIPMPEQPKE